MGYQVKENPENNEAYVTVTEGMRGWFAVLLVWNEDGFYEPWNSGFGSYKTKEEAYPEAKDWAEAEDITFVP